MITFYREPELVPDRDAQVFKLGPLKAKMEVRIPVWFARYLAYFVRTTV